MAPSVARFARMLPLFGLFVSTRSFAQSDPSSAAFPQEPPAAAPTTAAPAEAPVAQPAPAPAPAAQPAPAQPPPPAAAPAPAPAPAPAAATAPPAAYEPGYPPPPPPPEPPKGEGFKMPPISVRIDPFNWLINGTLGFEFEVGVLDFMSVELVPEFVVNEQPPGFGIAGREDTLYRESDGIGPISGTSIGLGFWLEGKALHGYVLRAILTNYSYHYVGKDAQGEFDNVSHVDRHFYGYFGSHAVWGVFTLAGGIGLGVELNKEKRCFEADGTPTRTGCDNELLIKMDRNAETVADLSGGLGGVQILGRISLGVTID